MSIVSLDSFPKRHDTFNIQLFGLGFIHRPPAFSTPYNVPPKAHKRPNTN